MSPELLHIVDAYDSVSPGSFSALLLSQGFWEEITGSFLKSLLREIGISAIHGFGGEPAESLGQPKTVRPTILQVKLSTLPMGTDANFTLKGGRFQYSCHLP